MGRVHFEISCGVAYVTLDSPARRNALSAAMWKALREFALQAVERKDIRVVMVRGAGGELFSAGADISDFAQMRSGAAQAGNYDDMVEEVCQTWEAIPQPTIAVLHGACIGAGASLAASCDMIVAAETAYLAVPAARLGLGYDPRGVLRFVRLFGLPATRTLLYTAGRLSAERVYAAGAIHRLVPHDEVDSVAAALAEQVAGNAPLTLAAAKASMRAIGPALDAELMKKAHALAALADASLDYEEGRSAFAQKRVPVFRGR